MNMNLDTSAVTILAALGGAVVGALATYLGAISMYRITVRNQARDEFYRVFAPLLDHLLRGPSSCPNFVLEDTACSQRIVAHKLMHSFSMLERRRFRRVWQNYIGVEYPHSDNIHDILGAFPRQYSAKPGNEEDRREKYQLAVSNLKRLLEFTK